MSFKKDQIIRGIIIRPDDIAADGVEGEIKVGLTSKKLHVYLDGALRSVVTEAQVQTLTNKTLTSPVINTGVSGTAIDTDVTLAANSDTKLATQKAVKTYVDVQLLTEDAADEIAFTPAGTISATNVQDAIEELDVDVQTVTANLASEITRATTAETLVQTNLTAHINDATDAHAASAITNTASGNLVATTVQAALNELQGDIDTINSDIVDDVEGPASSTDNALARFDSTTGKLIQNSGAILSDTNELSGLTKLNVDNIEVNGNTITSSDTNGDLILDANGTGKVNISNPLVINNGESAPYVIDSTSGANLIITATGIRNIRLAGAVTSIAGILGGGVDGQIVTIINNVGSAITVLRNSGALNTTIFMPLTAGTGIMFPHLSSMTFTFNSVLGGWYPIGEFSEPTDTTFTIANNTVSLTNVTGLSFSGIDFRGVIIDYTVYRKTDTALSGVAQIGELKAVFNTQSSTWLMSDTYSGQNSGVTFSMTALGQIQYTSTNITGATYAGTMTYSIRKRIKI